MNREELETEINSTLAEQFEISQDLLKPESHLMTDLGLDSLDAVDMLVHLEDQVGIKLDVEKLQKAQTLGDVYSMVEDLVASK